MANLLRAPLFTDLGVPHGFGLRTGGVSVAPFDSLNVARNVGDNPAHVQANLEALARSIGYDAGGLLELSQVHGAVVHVVGTQDDPIATRAQDGDVLVALSPGVAIGIRVADCIAVLIHDPVTGAVAAAHAGWRGVVAGAATAAIDTLVQRAGSQVEYLRVATFPHIRQCCFEVGDDVATQIASASSAPNVIDRSRDKPHVDLFAVLRAQLLARGVDSGNLQDVPGCTYCDRERFFSFRRDGNATGRHLAVIVAGTHP